MTTKDVFAFFLILSFSCALGESAGELKQSNEHPPLPQAVTNNAVASVATGGGEFLISFAGLGEGRTHADTRDVTWVFSSQSVSGVMPHLCLAVLVDWHPWPLRWAELPTYSVAIP